MSTGNDSSNAMTEIALALAMAFFAIMVLTMASMGAGGPVKPRPDGFVPARVVPSTAAANKDGRNRISAITSEQIVIFANDRFYNGQLEPTTPAAVARMDRPVLAVSSDLTMGQVLAAKRRLPVHDITVTTLNPLWKSALKEMKK